MATLYGIWSMYANGEQIKKPALSDDFYTLSNFIQNLRSISDL